MLKSSPIMRFQPKILLTAMMVILAVQPSASFLPTPAAVSRTCPGRGVRRLRAHAPGADVRNGLSRRSLLSVAVPLLTVPLLSPATTLAAPGVRKVWGVAVPLAEDVLRDLIADEQGVRVSEVFQGIGRTPTSGEMVRVQLTAFSMSGKPLGNYAGTERLFELGKVDMPIGIEKQVEAMKIGAQRIIVLDPEVGFRSASTRFQKNMPQDEPILIFARLLGIKGHPCSSTAEERAKGNMIDFHVCGEVNERTEKIRLFCEKSQSGVCVEPDYLKLQARNAGKRSGP